MITTRSLAARAAIAATMFGGTMVLAAATPASTTRSMFGGPWISVETPVNPYDASTRGALFVVHTFVHVTPSDMPVVGRAEGLVDGKRRSVPITLAKSSRAGTYAVQRQWGDKGIWTVLVTAMPGALDGWRIQAVVDVGADGEVERVSVPHAGHGTLLTDAEIDRALRDRARGTVAMSAR
jgi:hypothetical protein